MNCEYNAICRSLLAPPPPQGYCLYSSSTLFVLTVGAGVDGVTYDRAIGEFVLTHPQVRPTPPHAPVPDPSPRPIPTCLFWNFIEASCVRDPAPPRLARPTRPAAPFHPLPACPAALPRGVLLSTGRP